MRPIAVLMLLSCVVFMACIEPDARLRELAAPHVSCTHDELRFVEGRGNENSAVCVVECDRGPPYHCISRRRHFGDEPDTVCSPDATAKVDSEESEP